METLLLSDWLMFQDHSHECGAKVHLTLQCRKQGLLLLMNSRGGRKEDCEEDLTFAWLLVARTRTHTNPSSAVLCIKLGLYLVSSVWPAPQATASTCPAMNSDLVQAAALQAASLTATYFPAARFCSTWNCFTATAASSEENSTVCSGSLLYCRMTHLPVVAHLKVTTSISI